MTTTQITLPSDVPFTVLTEGEAEFLLLTVDGMIDSHSDFIADDELPPSDDRWVLRDYLEMVRDFVNAGTLRMTAWRATYLIELVEDELATHDAEDEDYPVGASLLLKLVNARVASGGTE